MRHAAVQTTVLFLSAAVGSACATSGPVHSYPYEFDPARGARPHLESCIRGLRHFSLEQRVVFMGEEIGRPGCDAIDAAFCVLGGGYERSARMGIGIGRIVTEAGSCHEWSNMDLALAAWSFSEIRIMSHPTTNAILGVTRSEVGSTLRQLGREIRSRLPRADGTSLAHGAAGVWYGRAQDLVPQILIETRQDGADAGSTSAVESGPGSLATWTTAAIGLRRWRQGNPRSGTARAWIKVLRRPTSASEWALAGVLWLDLGPSEVEGENPMLKWREEFRAMYEAGEIRASSVGEHLEYVIALEFLGADSFGSIGGYVRRPPLHR